MHRSKHLETNFTVVNIKNKQPNYSEQSEKERKTSFQIKLGSFTFGLITAPFIKNNLVSHKLGDYLNTANSCGTFLKLQLNPSFPKEQKGTEAQDTFKNSISVPSRGSRKELKLLISRSNSLTSNKDGREKGYVKVGLSQNYVLRCEQSGLTGILTLFALTA